MIELIKTNECQVHVSPKKPRPGKQTAEEAHRACELIEEQIKCHVDGCEDISIQPKYVYEAKDGELFDTLYEALEYLYDYHGAAPFYCIHYERPSDNGTGTRTTANSFEKVIEEAWFNPHKFVLLEGSSRLTEEQDLFLNRVLEAARNRP